MYFIHKNDDHRKKHPSASTQSSLQTSHPSGFPLLRSGRRIPNLKSESVEDGHPALSHKPVEDLCACLKDLDKNGHWPVCITFYKIPKSSQNQQQRRTWILQRSRSHHPAKPPKPPAATSLRVPAPCSDTQTRLAPRCQPGRMGITTSSCDKYGSCRLR